MEDRAALPQLVEHVFRRHHRRMVAGLTRILGPGRLELVEDVVQEALLRALKVWPFEGVPERPEAWLIRAARNLALDALRREAAAERHAESLRRWAQRATQTGPEADEEIADASLRMIFTCCRPELPAETRVALTLRTLCGFGVTEIAAALLQKESAVAQRLSRARTRLARDRVPFEVPAPAELPHRSDSVLDVLYLMFNEGYSAHAGSELVRRDLVEEALRLTGLLLGIPEVRSPKVHALAALMCFLGSRLPARTGESGELLTLARQDRSLWDREWIRYGFHHFELSIGGNELSPFHVEAAIASLHAVAPGYEETDWPRILARYDQLLALRDSPVARLNRAVALAKVRGPDAALAELESLAEHPSLARYHLLPATRGRLLWARGDHEAAAACFARARQLTGLEAEQRLCSERIEACRRREDPPPF